MARRRIGQEAFGFIGGERGRNAGLDALDRVIDWAPVEAALRQVYAAAKGEPAWPPLALAKALLLGLWYDLSDARLAEALDDRASFRRFCGFSATEPVPERTAFVRFRRELARRRLAKRLFAAVTAQLEAGGVAVKTGTLVDATVIRSASRGDGEASWGRTRRGPIHGYKAHIAADGAGGIVRRVAVTPANVHDSQALERVLPPRPGEVFADAAYDHRKLHKHIRDKRGLPRIARRIDKRSRPALNDAKKLWNKAVAGVRCRVEKIFGTAKRSYGLARARYRGLARVTLQVHLTFIAYNLRRALGLIRAESA
jgi:transposase, IS5 family